jgi:hypothetical protein
VSRPTHIEDLARPRVPWWLDLINVVAAPYARRLRFDPDALLAQAKRQTGLDDFGPPGFLEPFRLVCEVVDRDVPFSAFGRATQRRSILAMLKTRLRVEALIVGHPEILEQEIARPIVIAGLPRTGTTHLFNLVSQHPALRSLPYWESLEPIPGAKDRPKPGEPDPRIARCEKTIAFMHDVMPLFPAMHEFEAEVPHEEVQLQMHDFATALYESMLVAPRYGEWYERTDQTPHYAYLKRMLQVCQFLRGGTRWILKSPQHIAELPALFATFPDAFVIRTHRDPVRIVASLATMITYGRRTTIRKDAIDPHSIGAYWAHRIERWLHKTIDDAPRLPADRILDVRFHEFMQDDVATAERALEWARQPVTSDARAAIDLFAKRNVRDKHGRIDYRLEDLGLDAGDLRTRFRFYQDHFDIPDDG